MQTDLQVGMYVYVWCTFIYYVYLIENCIIFTI